MTLSLQRRRGHQVSLLSHRFLIQWEIPRSPPASSKTPTCSHFCQVSVLERPGRGGWWRLSGKSHVKYCPLPDPEVQTVWCTWPTLTAVGWRGLTLQGSLLRPSEQTRHQVKGTGTAFSEKCRCNAVEALPKKLAMPRGTCTNSLSAHPESHRGVLRPGKWWRPDYPRQNTKDLSFGQFWC